MCRETGLCFISILKKGMGQGKIGGFKLASKEIYKQIKISKRPSYGSKRNGETFGLTWTPSCAGSGGSQNSVHGRRSHNRPAAGSHPRAPAKSLSRRQGDPEPIHGPRLQRRPRPVGVFPRFCVARQPLSLTIESPINQLQYWYIYTNNTPETARSEINGNIIING